ncbi:MAG: STAS domain-containing protein [Sphingobacteriales bacterium]|nr:MAG: STAS domain-containing protein [Sphingobacteriales bacterium]
MEVKTSTKEKFTVISGMPQDLSVTMTEDLCRQLTDHLGMPVKNIVLDMAAVQSIDEPSAEKLVKTQQDFYEAGASFVIFGLSPAVEAHLDELDLLELMNVTPTESEAWDIVQMEEIERELLDEDEPE